MKELRRCLYTECRIIFGLLKIVIIIGCLTMSSEIPINVGIQSQHMGLLKLTKKSIWKAYTCTLMRFEQKKEDHIIANYF